MKLEITNTRDIGCDDVVALARRQFMKGERIELPELARELGISRATLYRRIGNLDYLLGQVIASFVAETDARVRAEIRGRGVKRVLQYLRLGMGYIAEFEPLRNFLEQDLQRGLRIIASRFGPVQGLTIANHQRLLEEELKRGTLTLPVDAHTMAYALTRTCESFLYADLISGEEPDLEKAMVILGLMLGH